MATATLDVVSGQLMERVKADLGLEDDDLVRALGVDTRTIGRWRGGMHPQSGARKRLHELEELADRVLEVFGSNREAAKAWLRDDARYLGGLSPLDALRAGRLDRVAATLEALESGLFM